MFDPVRIPFGSKMLFNTIRLRPGVSLEEVEIAIGEMCNVVRETYGGEKGGFIAGQVLRFSGFASPQGTLGALRDPDHDLVIVTYWNSFEDHERSHADAVFQARFAALAELVSESAELGYEMLWQGSPQALEP